MAAAGARVVVGMGTEAEPNAVVWAVIMESMANREKGDLRKENHAIREQSQGNGQLGASVDAARSERGALASGIRRPLAQKNNVAAVRDAGRASSPRGTPCQGEAHDRRWFSLVPILRTN